MAILTVSNLTKVFGNKHVAQEVLKGLSFKVEKGEFISIMGPSGSGKTTLLNLLSSIDYVTQGSVELNGHQLQELTNKELSEVRKREIGFIFQDYNLLNTLSVKSFWSTPPPSPRSRPKTRSCGPSWSG